mmetsp:Transcript_11923/g.14415  ORF Transcript_11923/g.14415 Transcript_11923/m.14415 type:complete len:395 (+) Transcript_11923:60-1244(+)
MAVVSELYSKLLVLSLDAVTVSACIAWLILRGKRGTIKPDQLPLDSGIKDDESNSHNQSIHAAATSSSIADEIDFNPIVSSPEFTEDEKQALSDLRRKLKSAGLLEKLGSSMQVAAESRNQYLLRFLQARKLNVNNAYNMLIENIKWREKLGVNNIASKTAKDVLGCDISAIWPYTPQWSQGEDRQGRPIIYKEWGNFHFGKIKENATLDGMVSYHLWMNEQACRRLGQQSIKYGKPIDKFVCIFNAVGFTPTCMRNGAMTFLKEIAGMDQAHYPERLGCIIIVNAPRLISLVWNVVRTYLDPVTRDKIHIHASETEWRPIINRMIDDDQLVETLGGNAPVQYPSGEPIPLQTQYLDVPKASNSQAEEDATNSGRTLPKKSVVGRKKKGLFSRR